MKEAVKDMRMVFHFRRARILYFLGALLTLFIMLLVFSTKIREGSSGEVIVEPRFFFSIAVKGALVFFAPLITIIMTLGVPLALAIPCARKEKKKIESLLTNDCDIESFAREYKKNRPLIYSRTRDALIQAEISFYRGSFTKTQHLVSALTLEKAFSESEHEELVTLLKISTDFAGGALSTIAPLPEDSLLHPLLALVDQDIPATPLSERSRLFLVNKESLKEKDALCYHEAFKKTKENRYGETCLC